VEGGAAFGARTERVGVLLHWLCFQRERVRVTPARTGSST
jgi:hypothetical protein